MSYKVMSVEPTTVTLWDKITKDQRGHPTGFMTLFIGAHEFKEGEEVNLVVSGAAVKGPIQRCEVHNSFHSPGPNCNVV